MSNATSDDYIIFDVGQHVVYPQQGMGVIQSIEKKSRNGSSESYYNIYMKNADMNILIPISKAKFIGLRATSSTEEVKAALSSINNKVERLPLDWKERFQKNQDLINNGSLKAIAKVVQTLYHRSKIKELPIQEKRLYDSALSILIGESALALKRNEEEISTLILERLEG